MRFLHFILVFFSLCCFISFGIQSDTTSEDIKFLLKEAESDPMQIATFSKACFQGLMSSFPGEFCWKHGADAGKIPHNCPEGYERKLALCYEKCHDGDRHVGGVCWSVCSHGYRDIGVSCCKALHCHVKHSYIPHSITNFDSKIACDAGMYKSGALCYRDCGKIGYANCGIGACASNKANCASQIASMSLDAIMSVVNVVLDVVTIGTAAPETSALKSAVTKLGNEGLKVSFMAAKAFLQAEVKNGIEDLSKKVTEKAMKFLAGKIYDSATEDVIKKICEGTVETMANTMNKKDQPSDPLKTLDFLSISEAVEECKVKMDDSSKKLDCAKSIMESVGNFDPTGLLGLSAAFMHPECPDV